SQTKNPDAAMLLAQWLTNEENQVKRFTDRAMGPSNVKAAANPDVMANPALAALALQGSYAVSQNDVLGAYWEPAEAFGTAMETKDYTMGIQEQLDALVAQTIAK
ncbi:MAG: extracellular solute-binding protein, partial [Oscillospiraceae bacterium]